MFSNEALLLLLAVIATVATNISRVWKPRPNSPTKREKFSRLWAWKKDNTNRADVSRVRDIQDLSRCHETAGTLANLIETDGAGSWPPLTNNDENSWPEPLRPYKTIYNTLNPLLSVEKPSLDDETNRTRISRFRSSFAKLLSEQVCVEQVLDLLDAAESGRWDLLPRPTYNAFYACLGYCRHAYRWGIIPVVRVAQQEGIVNLPDELVAPWEKLQRHLGIESDSGNLTSSLLHNVDRSGMPVLKINHNLPEAVLKTEEFFVRLFYDIEVLALPIYCELAKAVIYFERRNGPACADSVEFVSKQLKHILGTYYHTLHDGLISRTAWMPHVQGFFAWAADRIDDDGKAVPSNGVSGNQLLLFMALDGFLGLDTYLDHGTIAASVPSRQRAVAQALEKASFRHKLEQLGHEESETRIYKTLNEILKQLRLFRSAHRHRARNYLSNPAPERLPMTAGKSVLKADIESSLEDMDQFMLKRLAQTV